VALKILSVLFDFNFIIFAEFMVSIIDKPAEIPSTS
jgi:hypothetical protein